MTTNDDYLIEYGYSEKALKSYYDEVVEEVAGNPEKLSYLDVQRQISDKYDLPMYTLKHINDQLMFFMKMDYIQNQDNLNSYDRYERNTRKLYKILDKRISDWLIRQSKVVENIQEGILKILENDFNLDKDTFTYVGGLLTISMIRYKESELDMITIKAVRDCISMFELTLLIEKYQKNIKELCEKWNDINEKLIEKTGNDIGTFDIEALNFSDTLYKTKFDSLKTYKKFFDNIDEYSSLFLESDPISKNIFVKGAIYEGRYLRER